jgi:peptidylprolyl isomerase
LLYKDIVVGKGATAGTESTISSQYVLMLWKSGSIISNTWSSTGPQTFSLNQVIAGWRKGIAGMKIGGRRLLVIPPALGYGATGKGPIGPDETLVFVVDLLGVS